MKKIGIDISQLNYEHYGIVNYILGFIDMFTEHQDRFIPIFFKNFRRKTGYKFVKIFYFPFKNFKFRKFWDNWIIGNIARFNKVDILITPYFATPPQKGFLKIPIIYDIGFLNVDKKEEYSKNYYTYSLNNSIKRADKIITLSDAVKSELTERFHFSPDNIYSVYPQIIDFQTTSTDKDFTLFLYVGTIEDRKNPIQAIEIFKKILKINTNAKFIFIGQIRDEYKKIFNKYLDELENSVRDRIEFLGTKKHDETLKMLNRAGYLLFPSKYEGFGIPVIEAFYSKTIPILNTTPIAKEVGGEGGLYFDCNKMEPEFDLELLFDRSFQVKMIQKGQEQLTKYKIKLEKQKEDLFDMLSSTGSKRS
ncbi:glycosyltransferase family 4 protein [bacterium]|nr:glycosyltransferase family 4 protein [bacterium]